jgi:hypothetical protein
MRFLEGPSWLAVILNFSGLFIFITMAFFIEKNWHKKKDIKSSMRGVIPKLKLP